MKIKKVSEWFISFFLMIFLTIILKKLYMIGGFVPYVSGLFVIGGIFDCAKIFFNRDNISTVVKHYENENKNYINYKKKENVVTFGFDMGQNDK